MRKPQLTLLLVMPSLVWSVTAHALILGNAKIDSSSGDPLYAEIPFSQAQSRTPIKVSIAQPFEQGIAAINDDNQTTQYNFYVRQNQSGSGIIVVTTSTPFTSPSVNLTLKVEDDGDTRYQQIKNPLPTRIERLKADLNAKPLQPQVIVNEADIALDLPISRTPPPPLSTTAATASHLATARSTHNESSTSDASTISQVKTALSASAPLVVSASNVTAQQLSTAQQLASDATQPPSVPSPERVATRAMPVPLSGQTSSSIPHQTQRPHPTMQQPSASQKPASSHSVQTAKTPATPSSTMQEAIAKTHTKPITKTTMTTRKHTVQSNENLWTISMAVAAQNQITVQQAMRQIKAANRQAFINGNAHLLRQGAVLQLPVPVPPLTSSANTPSSTPEKSVAPSQKPPLTAVKQSDAHLSIVAAGRDNSNAVGVERHAQHPVTAQLITSLKNRRRTTLALQQDVNDMDQKLKLKQQRLALINDRLAQLEKQLKQQPVKKSKADSIHKLHSFNTQPSTHNAMHNNAMHNNELQRFYLTYISMQYYV